MLKGVVYCMIHGTIREIGMYLQAILDPTKLLLENECCCKGTNTPRPLPSLVVREEVTWDPGKVCWPNLCNLH